MRSAAWLIVDRSGEQPIDPKAITRQLRDRQRSMPLKHRSSATAVLLLAGGEWTPHDLRRTAATLMGELGVRPDVIERALNHIEQNRMSRIYQRQSLEAEQQAAWHKLGQRLEQVTQLSREA